MASVGISGYGQAPETVAAAGSTIADAGALSGPFTVVTGGDGTKGVQLPDVAIGDFVFVHSDGGASKVYPPSSTGTINGGSAGAAVTVAADETAILYRFSSTAWWGGVAVTF